MALSISAASVAGPATFASASWKKEQAPFASVPALSRFTGLSIAHQGLHSGSEAASKVLVSCVPMPSTDMRMRGVSMVATEQKVATSTTLTELYEKEGQSPWLDNLKRDWLQVLPR